MSSSHMSSSALSQVAPSPWHSRLAEMFCYSYNEVLELVLSCSCPLVAEDENLSICYLGNPLAFMLCF